MINGIHADVKLVLVGSGFLWLAPGCRHCLLAVDYLIIGKAIINKLMEIVGKAVKFHTELSDGAGGESKVRAVEGDRENALHLAHCALRCLLSVIKAQVGVMHCMSGGGIA